MFEVFFASVLGKVAHRQKIIVRNKKNNVRETDIQISTSHFSMFGVLDASEANIANEIGIMKARRRSDLSIQLSCLFKLSLRN